MVRAHLAPRARRNVEVVTGILIASQALSTFVLPVPGSVIELAITSQISYLAFAGLAWWAADRGAGREAGVAPNDR